MKHTAFWTFAALLLPCAACVAAAPGTGERAQIQALRRQLDELKRSSYRPELGEQMLTLQIRHARLWFAGEAENWNLATYEVQELQEAFDAVVEQNPDNANLQPLRLADVLPAMTRGPIADLRKAVDGNNKAAFESAFDRLSAACTGCHHVAGNDMLVIQRPKAPLLDNLRVEKVK